MNWINTVFSALVIMHNSSPYVICDHLHHLSETSTSRMRFYSEKNTSRTTSSAWVNDFTQQNKTCHEGPWIVKPSHGPPTSLTNQTQIHHLLLLYGCECRTLKPTVQKALFGYYTKMLWVVVNISIRVSVYPTTSCTMVCTEWATKKQHDGCRMRPAQHSQRHQELPASNLMLWELMVTRSQGRSKVTFVEAIKRDTEAHCTNKLIGYMKNREDWRQWPRVRDANSLKLNVASLIATGKGNMLFNIKII